MKWNERQKDNLKIYGSSALITLIIFMSLISLSSASLGFYKVNDCVNIKTILNTSSVTISTISFPNSTLSESNKPMTLIASSFNYSYCSTADLGTYVYDYKDAEGNVYVNDFTITSNGKEPPTAGVIVLFSLLILIVLLGITYVIIYSIGHAVTLDFDIIDLAWNYGLFFAFLGTFYLQDFYMANPMITSILNWGVYIGIFTNLILPTVYFILTLTVGSWMKQRIVGVDM